MPDEPSTSDSRPSAADELDEKKSPSQPPPAENPWATRPNGGLRAWLQVAGSFFLAFNTWGMINTFGVYQTYYESGQLFKTSSSNISWIGSIQAFLLLLVGALAGPIYDAGYFRPLLFVGTFLVVFGQMMTSLVHEFWQALLAQGFCIGIGAGCLFVPSVAILPTYFTSKMPLAVGIAASGSSLGGLVYPIAFQRLLQQIGFGWATRVLGFLFLATLMIPIALMRVRILPPKKRELWDWQAFKEPQFVIFAVSLLIGFMGLYVPFFYIQFFAETRNITEGDLAFYLLAILNAGSVFGRILPNFVAGYLGPMNMLVFCVTITAILIWTLLSVHTLGGVVVFCLIFGFFSGTFVSLPPTVFVSLTKNHAMIGTRMGMGFSIISLGALAGTPIAGAILGDHGFGAVWNFSAAMVIASGVGVTIARFFENKDPKAKV
ncbi:hypothetical protein EYZ11_002934 [Aspergillus tanneri]|uniref:Major facilitator superfamily (MFS) profile domain-containing protein n=1 Tax=Aspergillus tanneri TaxID=1220188 RepID=A0A4S3JPH4_9EURO|nr:uncharacterized protein ATNIH1004_009519 [Aspergillus tanneri]KAA8642767.1 hypothetical protein ATNIH1004_009519 [Aspergillus tanneri]THC97579.1 hypothetical protein EYZ11_002934 [Aspergillus tanneri]